MVLPGGFSCRPPGTESLQKCSRCPIALSTWHGNPAKACQVAPLAVHLARFLCKSVPGVFPRLPPATVFPQKRVRCPFLLSTWHGIPAKAFQVSFPAVHLARYSRESVSGGRLLHHGMRWGGSSRAYGCFQHEACSRLHTCSPGIYASF